MRTTKITVLLLSFFLFACAQHDISNDPVPAPLPDQSKATDVNANILMPAPTEAPSSVIVGKDFKDNDTVYFAFDKSEITMSEKSKIMQQVAWLKNNSFNTVTVEGYTDIYGSVEYNIALGERRANAIKDILVSNGIDSNKIKIVSYGKDHLADPDVQSKNRRTITVVDN